MYIRDHILVPQAQQITTVSDKLNGTNKQVGSSGAQGPIHHPGYSKIQSAAHPSLLGFHDNGIKYQCSEASAQRNLESPTLQCHCTLPVSEQIFDVHICHTYVHVCTYVCTYKGPQCTCSCKASSLMRLLLYIQVHEGISKQVNPKIHCLEENCKHSHSGHKGHSGGFRLADTMNTVFLYHMYICTYICTCECIQ